MNMPTHRHGHGEVALLYDSRHIVLVPAFDLVRRMKERNSFTNFQIRETDSNPVSPVHSSVVVVARLHPIPRRPFLSIRNRRPHRCRVHAPKIWLIDFINFINNSRAPYLANIAIVCRAGKRQICPAMRKNILAIDTCWIFSAMYSIDEFLSPYSWSVRREISCSRG